MHVPQDKVEIVQRFFEARSRGDLSYLNYVDPDAEFDLSESRSTYQGVYRGHEQIREQWAGQKEAWAETDLRPEEPVVVGDRVVVTVHISARGRSSGVQLEGQGGQRLYLQGRKDRALQTLPDEGRGPRIRS